MNNRKMRVYSLLSWVLIFSTFGFVNVNSMENSENVKQEKGQDIKLLGKKRDSNKCSVLSFFSVIQNTNRVRKFSPKATSFDYAVGRLMSITCYAARFIVGEKEERKLRAYYNNLMQSKKAKSIADALSKGLSNFNEKSFPIEKKQLVIDNCRYVEMWYRALLSGSNGSRNAVNSFKDADLSNDTEKELTTFLRSCRYNIKNENFINEHKDKLSQDARDLGLKTQKIINQAIQNILKSFAPIRREQQSELINWENGCINGIKCEFKIFEDEDSSEKNNSLGVKEEE